MRLEQLRELGERLVHVHSQHHNLLLNDPRFQLGLVDHAAGHTRVVSAYRADFRAWKALADELGRIRDDEARSRTELDYLQFQLDELDQAQLKDGEQEGLEQDLQRAEHAGEILQGLQAAESAITAERGLLSTLAALRVQLTKAARHDPAVNTLLERLNSVGIELKDISAEAETMAAGTSLDPREEQRLRERLDTLLRLEQKHRVKDTASLIALAEELRERTQRIGSMSARIAELEGEERAMHQNVMTQAKQISDTRRKAMPALASEVADLLKQLGMPHARFVFDHHTTEPGPQGVDVVRALFSANKDRAPEALDKVASGGELSRLMLALISLSAENLGLPTVIFDEIDTGVSGEVADRVGSLMARMAADRQIIAITHLPQIASKAHMHLLVSKDHEAEQVTTSIRPLAHEERVQALAQMLSGKKTTKAALDNARELLKGK